MSEPTIAHKSPITLELEAGDYWFCTCGKSAEQPFCDGAHKGSDFAPQKFTIEEKRRVALCGCKHSTEGPFCDGKHLEL